MSNEIVPTRLPNSELGRSFMESYRRATEAIHTGVLGLDDIIEQVFIAMLADGHVLLEGEPGVGKTLLVTTFARTVNAVAKRVQFTPETYPGDLYYSIGSFDVAEERGRKITEARLAPGPIFTQILIGDEINRAPARVHAPLLEPLEEKKVTIEGKTTDVGPFYFFAATQNPVESAESTNELPEALRERFLLLVHVPYPVPELLRKIAVYDTRPRDMAALLQVADIVAIQNAIFEDYVLTRDADDPVISYVERIITALHGHRATAWGPGIRAGQDLTRAAAVHAFLRGRDRITFADVRAMAVPALRFKFARDVRRSRELGITGNDQLIRQTLAIVPIAPGA